MKQVFYKKEIAEKEKELRTVKKTEDEKRRIYFDRLAKDKGFEKYIMVDIIESVISDCQNISTEFSKLSSSTPEAVKSVIMEMAGGLKASTDIKNKIKRNMA